MSTSVDDLRKALEVGMYGSRDDNMKHRLRRFLSKLDIKSARDTNPFFTIESLEHILDAARYSFGRPDQLFMSPSAFEKLDKSTK